MPTEIPRRIWFHWMQGQAQMPPVTRECLASWMRHNPDWDVQFLDSGNVWDYVDRGALPVDALIKTSPQVYANAIRLALLNAHGGVWVDATVFCRKPLSGWLTDAPGGFFAFSTPGPDRMLSNWFFAAVREHYLVRTLLREYLGIFERLGPLAVLPDATTAEMLRQACTTDVFFGPSLHAARRYPYYLIHYLFAYLYRRDAQFRQAWDAARKISAEPPHVAQSLALAAPADEAARQALRAADPLMHKLNWRIGAIVPGSLLHDIVTGAV